MLPLLTPFILSVLFLGAVLLCLVSEWQTSILLLVIALVINWKTKCFTLRLFSFSKEIRGRKLRVMSFNVNSNFSDNIIRAQETADLIKRDSPDVVFITELSDQNRALMDEILQKDYPYSVFEYIVPHCFYSKYPLTNWKVLEKNTDIMGSCVCNLLFGDKVILLIGCHFASNNFINHHYFTPQEINGFRGFKKYLNNIRKASKQRLDETKIVSIALQEETRSVIVLGDFNDVSGAEAMRELEKSGLKDAWWEKGIGYGATIHYPAPFRIDHILYSGDCKLDNIAVVSSNGMSDHDALVADFFFLDTI